MPKPLWSDYPDLPVAKTIKTRRAGPPHVAADGFTSPADGWMLDANVAFSCGFDMERPPDTASMRVAKLRAEKDFRTLNREYEHQGLNFEADREAKALNRWLAMRKWASEPSAQELRAEQVARDAAEIRNAEIESRARAIVAEENRAALERAREQARKELEEK